MTMVKMEGWEDPKDYSTYCGISVLDIVQKVYKLNKLIVGEREVYTQKSDRLVKWSYTAHSEISLMLETFENTRKKSINNQHPASRRFQGCLLTKGLCTLLKLSLTL